MLKEPIRIGSKTIKNRLVLPPMAPMNTTNPDGTVSEFQFDHYPTYAKNGNGLVIIEASAVSEMHEPRTTIGLFDDRFLPGLSKLAALTKINDAVVLVQLINTGLSIMEEESIAEISREKFLQYQADFVSAAQRVQKADFDGIELHAAHGFYLNTVVENSERTDEYGGNLENRLRYVTEIIENIRKVCGKDFIIGIRMGARPDANESIAIAKAYEKAGADVIHVSFGCDRNLTKPEDFTFDARIYAAKCIKEQLSVPVICVGGIKTRDHTEEILESGYADLCAVGTAQLADKEWALRALQD